MKNILSILLPLICLLFACTSEAEKSNTKAPSEEATSAKPSTEKSTERASKIEPLGKDYPDTYKSENLPMWDKATVEQSNKIKNDRGTRYQVSLATTEDVHTAARYYNKIMPELGWTNKNPKAQLADRRSMRFIKEGKQTMINVVDLPDLDKRIITIVFSVKE